MSGACVGMGEGGTPAARLVGAESVLPVVMVLGESVYVARLVAVPCADVRVEDALVGCGAVGFAVLASLDHPDVSVSTGRLREAAHFNGCAVVVGMSMVADARGCVMACSVDGCESAALFE